MPKAHYRYYCLDGGGRLHEADWVEAASDQDAVAKVLAMHPGSLCEIWLGNSLVARITPDRMTA